MMDKSFKSLDGGQNWINLLTPILDGQYMTNIEVIKEEVIVVFI